ncbi:succinate dehydrogenase assembly factor 2 [Chachezhania sediminis]|uniref:succinate dehydrogenase assembly factor 2 n=1 Tax=Chachezhania sediminis TaxID=2599291 RepID=UPI00131DF684|nr:succinate dehydrogenase assembly factor 2 [Chachezhania sediminis]
MNVTVEPREIRLKRLKMRSMRRGIKEMDLLLSTYADTRLPELDEAGLDIYDRLLEENDQDLYAWVCGRGTPPAYLSDMLEEIAVIIQNNR